MQNENVSSLMLADHAVILGLLSAMEESDEKSLLDSFERFKWKLELHMLIEERLIFTAPSFSNKSTDMIAQIVDEHKMILAMLSSMERQLLSGNLKLVIDDFKELLDAHRLFEDKELYPRLDGELEGSTKAFIIEQLKTRLFPN